MKTRHPILDIELSTPALIVFVFLIGNLLIAAICHVVSEYLHHLHAVHYTGRYILLLVQFTYAIWSSAALWKRSERLARISQIQLRSLTAMYLILCAVSFVAFGEITVFSLLILMLEEIRKGTLKLI
jgi:hypothetical protein